jgi:hypothetical protein
MMEAQIDSEELDRNSMFTRLNVREDFIAINKVHFKEPEPRSVSSFLDTTEKPPECKESLLLRVCRNLSSVSRTRRSKQQDLLRSAAETQHFYHSIRSA